MVAEAGDPEEFAVADCLSGLGENDPSDLGFLRAQIEVAEVAEEKHPGHFCGILFCQTARLSTAPLPSARLPKRRG